MPARKGFSPFFGFAIVFTGRATAFISSPGLMRLVAGPRGGAGLAGLAGLALAVIAPGLRPLGLAMVPPMRASRAVCVGRLLPTGVLNRPPLAVAPWPALVKRPQLSRL